MKIDGSHSQSQFQESKLWLGLQINMEFKTISIDEGIDAFKVVYEAK